MANDNVVHLSESAAAANPVEPDAKIVKALESALEMAKAGELHAIALTYIDESNKNEWTLRRFWRVGAFERAAWLCSGLSMLTFELSAGLCDTSEDVEQED